MALPISITSINSFSPLGNTSDEVWENYLRPESLIADYTHGGHTFPAAGISPQLRKAVSGLKSEQQRYSELDDSVLYALLAARGAVAQAAWKTEDVFGVNIGSSRGATQLFEKHFTEFITTGRTSAYASPSTTLGNISSWVAHDLKSSGPDVSHSITCSTSLHALLNGVAWLRSGMATKFIVGGSEAPLTAFTIAQMKAMKVYSTLEGPYPCRAADPGKTKNSMVLGEGAAVACLEPGRVANALAIVEGIGYATEQLQHGASISANAECLQKSMRMALGDVAAEEVDVVVMHAPGTIKGDISEYNAIKEVFGGNLPLLTTNKWKTGHTFGTSGMLSVEMAVLMMRHNTFIPVPFVADKPQSRSIRKVLVNSVGFGGNAVSVLLSR